MSIRSSITLIEKSDRESRKWQDESRINWRKVPNWVRLRLETLYPNVNDLTDLLTDGNGHRMETYQIRGEFDSIYFNVSSLFGDITQIKRCWKYDKGIMELQKFFLKSEAQGKGIAGRVLKGTADAAMNLEIEEFRMEASGSGGSVWPKAGFLPISEECMGFIIDIAESNLTNKGYDAETIANYMELLNKDDVKSIWQAADDPLGREALYMHGKWDGYLDLNNQEQWDRLMEFCRKKN